MNLQDMTYAMLKETRDQIESRLRELEQQTLADIEQKLRDFGITTTTAEPPKQKRHRRTKAEIEAANAVANGAAVVQ